MSDGCWFCAGRGCPYPEGYCGEDGPVVVVRPVPDLFAGQTAAEAREDAMIAAGEAMLEARWDTGLDPSMVLAAVRTEVLTNPSTGELVEQRSFLEVGVPEGLTVEQREEVLSPLEAAADAAYRAEWAEARAEPCEFCGDGLCPHGCADAEG